MNFTKFAVCALLTLGSFCSTGSAQDTLAESQVTDSIFRLNVFQEPLILVETGSLNATQDLLFLIQSFDQSKSKDSLDQIAEWADSHRDNRYTPSLLLNLGYAYFHRGYFTKAVEYWKKSWELSKDFQDHKGRLVADSALGQLSRMYGRVGLMQDIESLIKETKDRQLIGPGSVVFEHSADGYNQMVQEPEKSFKCGPMALFCIRRELDMDNPFHDVIRDAESTTQGTSLKQLIGWAAQMEMEMVPVKRVQATAAYPVPSVVNWKLGHYAAISKKIDDNYLIQDPTFGSDLLISQDALDKESSGYFLVFKGSVPAGYEIITESEADTVWGKGETGKGDELATDPCSPKAGGGSSCDCCPSPQCESGQCPDTKSQMAKYSFNVPLVSLSISDTPVGYHSSVGPDVHFIATYNQREANQPTQFNYGNLSHQWTYNWYSAVEDNPSNPNGSIIVGSAGGGGSQYKTVITGFFTSANATSGLHKVSDSPIVYERRLQDGSKQVYSHVLSNSGTLRKILLTEFHDPAGNKVTLQYDGNHRLISITDATNLVTSISYLANTDFGTSEAPYLISSVMDPYGRSAHFYYDSSNRLAEIKDTLGYSSKFTYATSSGSQNFITSLENPYGITTFEKEPSLSSTHRWVKAIDQHGESEMVEFFSNIPALASGFSVPSGFFNNYHQYRNCVFWNKRAMKEAFGDLNAAHIYHFLHKREVLDMSRTIEHEKPPLGQRTFYKYPGSNDNREGTANTPIRIGRKLDDGTDQIYQYEYNDKGKKTKSIDSLGRTTVYQYAPNNIDLTAVYRLTGTSSETLVQIEYDNPKHLPTKITDVAGQEANVTYNSFGQPLTITNALNQTVSYDYGTTGLLQKVTGIDPQQFVEFFYDQYDRITSATVFPLDYTVQLAYDNFNRPIAITFPDGTTEETVYDRFDVARTKDRFGQWTQFINSPTGELSAVINPAGETIQLDWCKCGALSRLVDAEGRITVFDYDLAGRLTRKELPDGSSTTYDYFPISGRVKSVTDAKGQVTNATYNKDGSVAGITVTNVAPGTAPVAPLSFTYDQDYGRLASRTDGIGTTNYTYHPINPADSVYGDGCLASVNGPWGDDTITYTYDKLRRTTQRQINGTANTVSVVYDSFGRLESITNPLSTFTYAYKPHTFMLTGISSPDGGSTLLGHKDALEDFDLDFIENIDPLSNPLSKFSYAQDVLGRITEWVQQEGSDTSQTFTAEYDKSSRLTQWTKSDDNNGRTSQWNWRFDRAGNRLSQQLAKVLDGTVAREKYSVNEADQVKEVFSGGPLHVSGQLDKQGKINTGVTSASVLTNSDGSFSVWTDTDFTTGSHVIASDFSNNTTSTWVAVTPEPLPTHEFDYDANGNTTKVITTSADGLSSSVTTYEWDAWDQLVAVVKGSHRSEFTYDGMGRRVRILELDGAIVASDTYYLWEGLTITEERTASGSVSTKLFYAGLGERHTEGTSANYFYATDHLGSVRQVIDESGAVVGAYSYDAYGNPTIVGETGGFTGSFLYTGHLYHRPSGLYLAPYRAYDPTSGKWLSREPLGLDGPNSYHYTNSDPLSYKDPTGLFKIKYYKQESGKYRELTAAEITVDLDVQKITNGIEFLRRDFNCNKNLQDYWGELGWSKGEINQMLTNGSGPTLRVYLNGDKYSDYYGEFSRWNSRIYVYPPALKDKVVPGTLAHELGHYLYHNRRSWPWVTPGIDNRYFTKEQIDAIQKNNLKSGIGELILNPYGWPSEALFDKGCK